MCSLWARKNLGSCTEASSIYSWKSERNVSPALYWFCPEKNVVVWTRLGYASSSKRPLKSQISSNEAGQQSKVGSKSPPPEQHVQNKIRIRASSLEQEEGGEVDTAHAQTDDALTFVA